MTKLQRTAQVLINRIKAAVGTPKLGCEIGVHRGGTSKALMEAFPELLLMMVDPWLPYPDARLGNVSLDTIRARMQESIDVTENVEQQRVLVLGTSDRVSKFVGRRLLDFVYIDGNHLYDSVFNDIAIWHPRVRRGGLVCGHDFNEAINWKRNGVCKAVRRYCEECKIEFQLDPCSIWWFVR